MKDVSGTRHPFALLKITQTPPAGEGVTWLWGNTQNSKRILEKSEESPVALQGLLGSFGLTSPPPDFVRLEGPRKQEGE